MLNSYRYEDMVIKRMWILEELLLGNCAVLWTKHVAKTKPITPLISPLRQVCLCVPT